jgi:hypothetical protein
MRIKIGSVELDEWMERPNSGAKLYYGKECRIWYRNSMLNGSTNVEITSVGVYEASNAQETYFIYLWNHCSIYHDMFRDICDHGQIMAESPEKARLFVDNFLIRMSQLTVFV